jgi:hypothetical protein
MPELAFPREQLADSEASNVASSPPETFVSSGAAFADVHVSWTLKMPAIVHSILQPGLPPVPVRARRYALPTAGEQLPLALDRRIGDRPAHGQALEQQLAGTLPRVLLGGRRTRARAG